LIAFALVVADVADRLCPGRHEPTDKFEQGTLEPLFRIPTMSIRRTRVLTQAQTAAERLEIRILPTVTATLSGGILTLKGDNTANDILIEQSGADLVITGNGGTQIRFNGQLVGQQIISGVQNLKGTFGSLNDRITFDTGVQLGTVTLNLGAGSNDVVVRDTTITGLFNVTGGAARDRLEFDASTLNNITLNLGNGNDEVEFLGTTVNGLVLINTGNGLDVVETNEGTGGVDNSFLGAVAIMTGNQADTVDLKDSTFLHVGVDSGADNDDVDFDGIDITGRFGISAGSGNDEVTVVGVTQSGNGMNCVMGGSGIDEFDFKDSSFNSFVDFDLGSGPGNTLEIDDVHFNSWVTVFSIGKNDQIAIEQDLTLAGSTEFVGTLAIQMGPGGTIGFGTNNAASWTETSAQILLKGARPSLIATVLQARVDFFSLPQIKNVDLQLV
jgi:hypothetical protein